MLFWISRAIERRGRQGLKLGQGPRIGGHNYRGQARLTPPVEHPLPGDHLVEQAPESEDVRAGIRLLAL